jgi:uncharacterized protein (DUF1778 family)
MAEATEIRSERIFIRVTPSQKRQLVGYAQQSDCSLTDYMLSLVRQSEESNLKATLSHLIQLLEKRD